MAVFLSVVGLGLAAYAAALDTHSHLAPKSLMLQGLLSISLVLGTLLGILTMVTLMITRKSWAYAIPFCAFIVALSQLLRLWS
jgi:hypothetical protein